MRERLTTGANPPLRFALQDSTPHPAEAPREEVDLVPRHPRPTKVDLLAAALDRENKSVLLDEAPYNDDAFDDEDRPALDPSEDDSLQEQLEHTTPPAAHQVRPYDGDPTRDGMSEQASTEARRAEDRVQRLLADQALVDDLRANHFDGQRYHYFIEDLASYGVQVMKGWLYTGHIFAVLNDRRLPQTPSAEELGELIHDPHLREELASLTVAQALPTFRDRALRAGQWDPTKGASLTTFFVGACVYSFSNVYREHRRRAARWSRQDAADAANYDLDRHGEDVAGFVASREELRYALNRLKPREQKLVAAHLIGYTQDEIVEMYAETSVRAVEGVLHRWRTAEKKRREEPAP